MLRQMVQTGRSIDGMQLEAGVVEAAISAAEQLSNEQSAAQVEQSDTPHEDSWKASGGSWWKQESWDKSSWESWQWNNTEKDVNTGDAEKAKEGDAEKAKEGDVEKA